jgi:hypothetical protein
MLSLKLYGKKIIERVPISKQIESKTCIKITMDRSTRWLLSMKLKPFRFWQDRLAMSITNHLFKIYPKNCSRPTLSGG